MSGDLSLFGDDDPEEPAHPVQHVEPSASDWQIDLLRKALDARGLTTQVERQAAIEAAAERPVESLRALTQEEALRILSGLGQTLASKPRAASAWDERDEDTWIDRL